MRRIGRWTYYPELELTASRTDDQRYAGVKPAWQEHKYGGWVPTCIPVVSAWKLDNHSWWLRRRTGVSGLLDHCSYCWSGPYSWWMLYTVPPSEWLLQRKPLWDTRGVYLKRKPGHGQCTHQHQLSDAMRVCDRALVRQAEKAINRWAKDVQQERERILRSLAGIGGLG